VSDSLRNSRAGSRTIYQHGADVNLLFERRVAVVTTQSQHRSRKKWWIDTTSCAGARGWPHGCSALEKYRSGGKKFARIFSDYVRSLDFRMVYCAATGSQYQVYMKLCLLVVICQIYVAFIRRNCTELRPASRAPSTPGLPPRWSWLYQAPGAMGGRAEYAGVHGGHQERPRWGRSSELILRR
jgi:hypothetical protein